MSNNGPTLKPFVDWYEIWPGQAGRRTDDDGSWLQDPPEGVRLSIQEARRSEPIVRAKKPWEVDSVVYPCVIHENGRYRMWHWSQTKEGRFNCYQESGDGMNWERPELGLVEFRGSTANNLISSHEEFEIDSVFVDPTAGPEERYKAICPKTIFFRDGVLDPDMDWPKFRELGQQTGAASDPTRNTMTEVREQFGVWRDNVVLGAVSADGLRWRLLEDPLVNVGSTPLDTQNVAAFNPDTGEYLAFLRGFPEEPEYGVRGRRVLRRTGGKEFGNWHEPRFVLAADPQDPPTDDIYTPAYCRYPGVPGLYLMFPSIYHRLDSELDVQLAISRDGWSWARPERRPIITRESGDSEYGMIHAGPNLVPLNDDEWAVAYDGRYGRHDHGTPDAPCEIRWAIWQRNRLVALEAPVEGRVTTIGRPCHGSELRINFRTQRAGWVKLELVTPPTLPISETKVLEGFSAAEMETLTGDELDRVVTWNGKSDLSALRGMTISVRLQMARAEVFSLEF